MTIGDIIDLVKLPIRYFIAIGIVAGLLLFLPKSWLIALRVDNFVESYGFIIGIFFLVSLSLTFVSFVCKIKDFYLSRIPKKQLLQDIKNLDKYEKSVLREFYLYEKQTLQMPIEHVTVAGLIERNILQIVNPPGVSPLKLSSISNILMPISINKVVQDYLKLKPSLIDLPTVNLTKQQKEGFLASRPAFSHNIKL